jgi:2-amino-4-hydroxy-6-hydroxymethyldihydropteridine diphosphokinase
MGDRAGYLASAATGLHGAVRAVSPVYETEPFGTDDAQDPYLNLVIIAESHVDSRGWLAEARRLEVAAHRVRTRRWGPRTLDVDVVTVDDVRSDDPELTLPHPRAHQRAFVLVPWLDVDPDAVLPGHGRVDELLRHVDRSGVRRRDDVVLS